MQGCNAPLRPSPLAPPPAPPVRKTAPVPTAAERKNQALLAREQAIGALAKGDKESAAKILAPFAAQPAVEGHVDA